MEEALKSGDKDSVWQDIPEFITDIKKEALSEDVSEFTADTEIKEEYIPGPENPCHSNDFKSLGDNVKVETVAKAETSDTWDMIDHKIDQKSDEASKKIEKEMSDEPCLENSDVIKSEEVNIKSEDEEESISSNSFDQTKHKNHAVHKCNVCGYRTVYKNSFQRHLLRHRNPDEVKNFKCHVCNYKTFRKDDLEKHHSTHKNPQDVVKNLKCDECDYQTPFKYRLKEHVYRIHSLGKINLYKCNKCNFQTRVKPNFNRHYCQRKNSNGIDMLKCKHCNFKTLDKIHLTQHFLRKHNK